VTSSVITATETRVIKFQAVSRNLTVKNNTAGTTAHISFTENGQKSANANYFTLNGSDALSEPIRCTKIFVSCSSGTPEISVIASLTCIQEHLLVLTGADGYGGIG